MSSSSGSPPRLHRSRQDRVIAGVCGGLGETLGVDPTLVRLGFVAVALLGGASLLVYLILAIVLPAGEPVAGSADAREVTGLALIALGLIALAGALGVFAWIDWRYVGPGLLVVLGAALLLRRS
jgi:phage shock protein C